MTLEDKHWRRILAIVVARLRRTHSVREIEKQRERANCVQESAKSHSNFAHPIGSNGSDRASERYGLSRPLEVCGRLLARTQRATRSRRARKR